jgi:hypothetical protein
MGLKEKIPAAEQLLVTDVDTELGPRQIRFYWGDISTLIKKDSVVIISTNCFQPNITGMAWSKIVEKFPEIEERESDFKEVIISSPDSSLWPMGEEDHLTCVKYSNDENCRFPPAILVSPEYQDIDVRRLFVVRSLPKGKAGGADLSLIEKYQNMVKTCFPAIKAVEAQEQMHSAKPEAYEHVVLSALSGRQGYDTYMGRTESTGLIFEELRKSAESWLRASPWWRCIDIVCWDPGKNKEDILMELRNSIGLEKGAREKPESLTCLHQEVIKALKDLKRICVHTITFKGKDADSLLEEIERLDKVLSLDDLLFKEVGSAAGTLTEALVKWLARDIFGKGVALKKTFEKNIELLGESKENKPKVSKWVISFLQTLRVLRNCSAHAADGDGKHSVILPNTLAEEDMTVLFANLKRVLRLLLERIQQNNPG